jgi:hypothetical protein
MSVHGNHNTGLSKIVSTSLFSLLRERILNLDTSLHSSDSTNPRYANGTLAGKFDVYVIVERVYVRVTLYKKLKTAL